MADGKKVDAKTIDPFDVEALEKSLNDSATRVSTIWISFVIFGAYLAAAASNVSHRQLLLEETIKLPTVNIDLPLAGSSVLLPIAFLIFHVYVLLQVVLLARTAATYNDAVERRIVVNSDRVRIRQRLANTLFAQIFAGSPREREGILGGLLKSIAWVTLPIAPILVLLTFEFKFLPYHNHVVTWSHRFLIAIDLLAILLLWPAVLRAQKDITWRSLVQHPIGSALAAMALIIAGAFLSFPSEPHSNWTRFLVDESIRWRGAPAECRIRSPLTVILSPNFDRLSLVGEQLIDSEKFAKIELAGKTKGLKPHEGERTRDFRGRNFRCAILAFADLRRVDFSAADLSGANLEESQLQGARLDHAKLNGSELIRSQLQNASLQRAELKSAMLYEAQLPSSDLFAARAQDAYLIQANLKNGSLMDTQLQGALLSRAALQGASLFNTQLQGAVLDGAQLQGAKFTHADLQGANLGGAALQSAYFERVGLQGVDFQDSQLDLSVFSDSNLWRASGAKCNDARVTGARFTAVLPIRNLSKGNAQDIEATADGIEKFIKQTVEQLPESARDKLKERLSLQLMNSSSGGIAANEQLWRVCETKKLPDHIFEQRLAKMLIETVCKVRVDASYFSEGVYNNWISLAGVDDRMARMLARGLLGEDGKPCLGAQGLDEKTKERLRILSPK
jgi:uncharacterized protein YjbI with pentapeptide repeats